MGSYHLLLVKITSITMYNIVEGVDQFEDIIFYYISHFSFLFIKKAYKNTKDIVINKVKINTSNYPVDIVLN